MRVDWCVSSWFRIKNTHSVKRVLGRCGTHGGPPGRMILAQYVPRSTFGFLTELNALPPHGTNSRSFGTAALHGTTPPLDSPRLA